MTHSYDLDGDGFAETPGQAFDTDRDSVADTMGVNLDLDRNGVADSTFYDANNDGVLDTLYSDTTGDGVTDVQWVDSNRNGVLDTQPVDADNNGKPETLWVDQDEDGRYARARSRRSRASTSPALAPACRPDASRLRAWHGHRRAASRWWRSASTAARGGRRASPRASTSTRGVSGSTNGTRRPEATRSRCGPATDRGRRRPTCAPRWRPTGRRGTTRSTSGSSSKGCHDMLASSPPA